MSVAGTYDLVIKTPMGDQKAKFTVTPNGAGFTGSVTSDMMGSMDIADGKVDGNRITWSMDMKVPMPMTLEGDATVDGDAISGSVKAGAFGSMALDGKRAA